MNNSMASNIANQRIQREFREVVKSEEVKNSGVQVRIFRLPLRRNECNNFAITWVSQSNVYFCITAIFSRR